MTSLDKAIALHQTHVSSPKTATPESQEELMDLLYAAREETNMSMKRSMKETEEHPSMDALKGHDAKR